MDVNTLNFARLEFGLTAGTHFLFVGLTLGLATLVAGIQTRATISGDPIHQRMVRFWGQLYVINYAVGIVTGLVMELELGLNWSGLERFAGNVFGSSLALETITAFFLESTFLGLWIFSWGRLNKWAHLSVIWIVTLTAYASAYWIMVSNGFLQHPVGVRVVNGVLQLRSAAAVLSNESTLAAFGHVLGGGLVAAGLVMAGVSAYHLRRGTPEREFFEGSLRIGLRTALPALIITIAFGGAQFGVISDTQPFKMAVFGGDSVEIARDQAAAVGRYGPGNYLPSEGFAKAGYVMIGVWLVMLVVTIVAIRRLRRGRANPGAGVGFPEQQHRGVYALLVAAIPLPFVALVAGWIWRETGRQPWTVFGLLRTSDAVSDVSAGTMRLSLLAFSGLFAVLLVVNCWLLARFARRGPEGATLGRPIGELDPSPLVNPAF
jgi:cytochrome d ubiquinol oxidase subunit I